MTPYDQLKWLAYEKGPGSHRVVCPWCDGGTDREQSLSLAVASTGEIQFRCFRSTCGKGGGRKVDAVQKKEPRYFTADTVNVSEERQLWFSRTFGFVPDDIVYAPSMDRYVYTIRGPSLQPRGRVARSFSGAVPKVLTYNERPDEPFIGWAQAGSGTAVIVEDWVSAEKVCAAGFTGIALNGTHLTLGMVQEIAEHTFDQVYLALDKDAYAKSLTYLRDYGDLFNPRLRVWKLEQDLKYVSLERIEEAINGNTDFSSAGNGSSGGAHHRGATNPFSYYPKSECL